MGQKSEIGYRSLVSRFHEKACQPIVRRGERLLSVVPNVTLPSAFFYEFSHKLDALYSPSWKLQPYLRSFCSVLADSGHEDHERLMEWSGGHYDSQEFDGDMVNWELMKYLRWSRARSKDWGRNQ